MSSFFSQNHHPQFWKDHTRWNDAAYGLASQLDNNAVVVTQVTSPDEIAKAVADNKCSQVILMGHRGGPDYPGGIGTADAEGVGRVDVFPSDDFDSKMRNAISKAKSHSCRIYIYACGTDDPEGVQRQQALANTTGCTVCGTRDTIKTGGGETDFAPKTPLAEPGIICLSPNKGGAKPNPGIGWGTAGAW
jgi:hypothetical protein